MIIHLLLRELHFTSRLIAILTCDHRVLDTEGKAKEVELMKNGSNIEVTQANKKDFVSLKVNWKLRESVRSELEQFMRGFHEIVPESLLGIFREEELELLTRGTKEINVEDWKSNTIYQNASSTSQHIVWFWEVMSAISGSDRVLLLKFATGSGSVPPVSFSLFI